MNKKVVTALMAALFAVVIPGRAQVDLGGGLVAYWPLEEIVGGTQTPDVVSGLNMNLSAKMSEANIVTGQFGNAFSFDAADGDILTRVHNEGEALPVTENESFTVSLWVQGNGSDGSNGDSRVFSEASTLTTQPLFNIGTSDLVPWNWRG